MYKCNNCKKYFEQYKIEKELTGQDNQVGEVEFYYCPYCDSDNFEKISDEKYENIMYFRKYRKEHAKEIKEYQRKYYENNKDKVLERNRIYKGKDPEKWKKYTSEYNKKHPEYGIRSHEKFIETHDWTKYCSEARKRRADKLKEQGITNPYHYMNGGDPKYDKK